jgi:transaldolase
MEAAGLLMFFPLPEHHERSSYYSSFYMGESMKIFLDTANIDEIRAAAAFGILDGVTTNPSLIAKEKGDFIQSLYEICEIVQGPVSAETVSQDVEGMVREGRLLAQIHKHIVVKVPLTKAGIAATSILAGDGIAVNVTLCFQASQALLAAKAGAAYISPFLGRLDDISHDGVELIEQIVHIYKTYNFSTEVLAASVRHPKHFVDIALAGADVSTIPYGVLMKLFNHPLTDSGNVRFLKDWESVPNNNISEQVQNWLDRR